MKCDFLIIGSGIAGLSFALRVAQLGSVVIVTKKNEIDTATNLAQGGIAAVLSDNDSKKNHIEDTIISGAGLCDENVVALVVGNGPERVRELMLLGVDFVKDARDSSGLDLGREGGHSERRVAHAHDFTGREIERALLVKVKQNPKIQILENHRAIDLLMVGERSETEKKGPYCAGAYVLTEDGNVETYQAKVTILCTGGTGKVYLYTTNPDIATGDGLAMAFRAGAVMANMEFVQFHPTCLYHPKAKNFLISEAVRGEGAILVDREGRPFMEKYDSRKDLATRDTVARAMDKEMKESGVDCVFLDITHKDKAFVKERFPTIYARCLEYGIDITSELVPVVPAAHYMCGGVQTDTWGRTSVDGLLALGETACTGLHGGNRLASNSLLEAVVFAERAYEYCADHWSEITQRPFPEIEPWQAGGAKKLNEEILIHHNWDLIRRIMWNYVGIVRTVKRLQLAQRHIKGIFQEIEEHYRDYFVTPNMIELRNIALVSLLIIQSALLRKESRGLHYLVDYPESLDIFKNNTKFRRKKGGLLGEIEKC
ncbi:MAG: L-aspartate oxidase [Proteobacteria bacterium]|jgi:L-aspartate oxidase|nr:L-aspartate oxidase [Desulfocapsa sp.]MBU3944634.1 L-aspartate oxidase [Pseudomonadota bacterium]MCG2743234.1 L-aspartate oxidase [Desulfobacteraceae bacterium]MBU4030281.1 L-aspartate oxidase [Pseudomonadota bacterium]MBU4044051.1 L-aspartate oxidase [Pseudomonadota bacterium]